jgi:hypothetical protein
LFERGNELRKIRKRKGQPVGRGHVHAAGRRPHTDIEALPAIDGEDELAGAEGNAGELTTVTQRVR